MNELLAENERLRALIAEMTAKTETVWKFCQHGQHRHCSGKVPLSRCKCPCHQEK